MKIAGLQKALATVGLVLAVTACGAMKGGPLPKDYPLPIYPNATAPSDCYREVVGQKLAILDTTDTPEKVVAFYLAELPKQGFENVKEVKNGEAIQVQATKGKDAAAIQAQSGHVILTYVKGQ